MLEKHSPSRWNQNLLVSLKKQADRHAFSLSACEEAMTLQKPFFLFWFLAVLFHSPLV
jgi:hypothetical protein